jgi:hypothetical protein
MDTTTTTTTASVDDDDDDEKLFPLQWQPAAEAQRHNTPSSLMLPDAIEL